LSIDTSRNTRGTKDKPLGLEDGSSAGVLWLGALRDSIAKDDLTTRLARFAATGGGDKSSARLRAATGGALDLGVRQHREALLDWLRSWGCRHLRRADTAQSAEVVGSWWREWGPRMPPAEADLTELDSTMLHDLGAAYERLARLPAAHRRTSSGREIDVSFGDTAAAKALFAVRPRAIPPWDEPIRRSFGWIRADAHGFEQFLTAASHALQGLASRLGVAVTELPRELGRPGATPAKLVDEYLWISITWKKGSVTRSPARPSGATTP
jgi:hypothetical protein